MKKRKYKVIKFTYDCVAHKVLNPTCFPVLASDILDLVTTLWPIPVQVYDQGLIDGIRCSSADIWWQRFSGIQSDTEEVYCWWEE